jgi:hypothetical protein
MLFASAFTISVLILDFFIQQEEEKKVFYFTFYNPNFWLFGIRWRRREEPQKVFRQKFFLINKFTSSFFLR